MLSCWAKACIGCNMWVTCIWFYRAVSLVVFIVSISPKGCITMPCTTKLEYTMTMAALCGVTALCIAFLGLTNFKISPDLEGSTCRKSDGMNLRHSPSYPVTFWRRPTYPVTDGNWLSHQNVKDGMDLYFLNNDA